MNEVWKDIKGFRGLYQVSNTGKVKSLRYNKILKFSINGKGYLQVQFTVNYKFTTFKVHRLVAQAFIPNPENKPEVNHKDGNKLNNNDWNLEWNTTLENNLHARKTGLSKFLRGEDSSNVKLTEKEVLQIRKSKNKKSSVELANIFNVTKENIRHILNNKTWKHI